MQEDYEVAQVTMVEEDTDSLLFKLNLNGIAKPVFKKP